MQKESAGRIKRPPITYHFHLAQFKFIMHSIISQKMILFPPYYLLVTVDVKCMEFGQCFTSGLVSYSQSVGHCVRNVVANATTTCESCLFLFENILNELTRTLLFSTMQRSSFFTNCDCHSSKKAFRPTLNVPEINSFTLKKV